MSAATIPAQAAGAARRLLWGGPEDPRWVRPALYGVLVLSLALHVWKLPDNGYANEYYAAAVQAGTQDWKAFFFGSLDAGSFITVDKPPMALWLMALSGRVLGFGTWSMLLPQALAGTAAVGVVHATARRAFGPVAGLLSALVLALTPITVAINRDNNPDTLLVLWMVLAGWATLRAVQARSGRAGLGWLSAAAFFVGCGFNTKMLQAWVVVPALALVYLVAARPSWPRRVAHLLAAGAVLVASSLWWVLLVDAIPEDRRPYIGGSTDNTAWDLVIGYNGLGRIFGGDGPGGFGRGGGANFGGEPGGGRMFNDILGGQISWLLPPAGLLLAAALVWLWRRPRTDVRRAGVLLFGGWAAVHFVVFSYSAGGFHPYYTTAMAPGIAGLVGGGVVLMAEAQRRSAAWAWVLPAGVAVTGAWSFQLLERTPQWLPWLRWAVAAATVAAVAALGALRRGTRGAAVVATAAGLVAGLAGPAAYAVDAAGSPVNGTNPLAGPATGFGGMGRGPGGPPPSVPRGGRGPGGGMFGGPPAGGGLGGGPGRDPGGPPPGMRRGGRGPGGGMFGGQPPGGGFGGRMFGGPGGGRVSDAMAAYLVQNRGKATWLVAVGSAQQASSLMLRTGAPVIAMGGFTGSDPAMTVAKLQRYVKEGRLRFILLGGRGGGAEVAEWVRQHATPVDAGEYGDPFGGSGQLYRLA